MFESITIVVPTYWGRASADAARVSDGIFDHPTPIDGESTLPRLLDSLAQLETDTPPFNVLVLVAAVDDSLEGAALERVQAMAGTYTLPIYTFGGHDLRQWQIHLDPGQDLLGMDTYARIRNGQLLAPQVMGAEVVIALDDDEVVEPDFVKRAVAHDSLGLAGIYVDGAGSPWLPEGDVTGNPYLDKPKIMNDGLRGLMHSDAVLPVTPIAYGGNMVFRRELWQTVPFDPGITRGEDIDYVLNAKLQGFDFHLDKDLKIIHLPPDHYNTPPFVKLSEDVRRF
ncbi:MAG: hypothetical protein AAF125_08315, partial [Chloroflexota bacterium]